MKRVPAHPGNSFTAEEFALDYQVKAEVAAQQKLEPFPPGRGFGKCRSWRAQGPAEPAGLPAESVAKSFVPLASDPDDQFQQAMELLR